MQIDFTPHKIKAAKAYLQKLTIEDSLSKSSSRVEKTTNDSPSLLQRLFGLFRRKH